ncbi:MAG: GNAT family N-acetyltransferase, partial [Bdellovibrionales bacterium]
LQTYAVQKGWSSAYLLSNRHFEGLGECNIRSHMILPLGASSEDALYQSIPKKQRNMIKKAQTQNYDISTSWIHFDAFYDIYKQHCRAKSLSTKPRLYFETLKRVFGDCITLYSALSNKEPVAGMIFLCSSHASSYLFNASSTDAQKNGVNNLLMWEAARHFHYQHQNYIELGFSTPQSPVYQFKKRLSKDICEQQLYGYELIFGNLAMPNRLKNMARNKYNGILQRLSLRSFMVEDPETKLF